MHQNLVKTCKKPRTRRFRLASVVRNTQKLADICNTYLFMSSLDLLLSSHYSQTVEDNQQTRENDQQNDYCVLKIIHLLCQRKKWLPICSSSIFCWLYLAMQYGFCRKKFILNKTCFRRTFKFRACWKKLKEEK